MPVLLGSFVDGKARQFDQVVLRLEGFTAVRLFRFESFVQQLRHLSTYLSQHDLLSNLVGFKSHLCQLNGIDVQFAKGEFECEFVGVFGECSLPILAVLVVLYFSSW